MIPQKSAKEIRIMQTGGRKLAGLMKILLAKAKPGVNLEEIEQLANKLVAESGDKPSFKMVKGYHWVTCLNVNQGVVHGVPSDYRLKKGDLLSIDLGLFYQGLHTDMARTIRMGKGSQDKKFLEAGSKALTKATKVVKPGNHVGHISQAIEKEIKKAGFKPIRVLTGHGVGRKLHEVPTIPGYLRGKITATEKLKPGMTLAIEVIYARGKPGVEVRDDGWTVETADGQLAGLFEDTVAVTKQGPLVLTKT